MKKRSGVKIRAQGKGTSQGPARRNLWLLVSAQAGLRFHCQKLYAAGVKGELDLVGYDGETLAFVEIRTRTVREDIPGLPELSLSHAKQSVLVRTAQLFLAGRHLNDCPTRFDVLAIRLHKDAFSPQLRRSR